MSDDGEDCAEALDPRVQVELERLNSATDEINQLEVELDEARLVFRRLLAEGHLRIQQLTRKLGTSVHKARPYYEARFRANITSQELQVATLAYDKANSAHTAAKEMMFLAEQGLARLSEGQEGGVTLDPAWQEMLNHATTRVNQAESDRASTATIQRARLNAYRAASALVQQLQGGLKRHITKSRPYFEEKARINLSLEGQKAKIMALEQQVSSAKLRYSAALRNLEGISDEIHHHRGRRRMRKTNGKETLQPSKMADKMADTDTTSDTNTSDEQLSELCEERSQDCSIRSWLRKVEPGAPHDDTWTEVDLDYSSPEDVSFEKCSLNPRSPSSKSSPPSPGEVLEHSRVSASSPRRIIRGSCDRTASLRAELEKGRRPSLDALLHDTGEKMKEMFQGFSLFGERRASASLPRSPRRAHAGSAASSDVEGYSDSESRASMEMLSDDQIASLMLDAQLEAVCDKLAGVGLRSHISPQSPDNTNGR